MNEKLFNPDYLLHLCQKYGLRPSKKYGQNYLINEESIHAMLEAGGVGKSDTVVEVGPGFGVLTHALTERAGRVIAFEIEKKIEPYWNEELKNTKNLEIVWGNVLKEFPVILSNSEESPGLPGTPAGGSFPSLGGVRMTKKYKVVSNLPYQITSPVIRTFLEAEHPPELMVFMVQKEVAERICAKPGDMSVLSIAVQYYADAEMVLQVPRSWFWPAPAVDSAVIKMSLRGGRNDRRGNPLAQGSSEIQGIPTSSRSLELRSTPRDDNFEKQFFHLVKIGFANRRKLLIKNLEPYVGKKNRDVLKKAFADLGLLPTARAQELSVEQWKELTKKLETGN